MTCARQYPVDAGSILIGPPIPARLWQKSWFGALIQWLRLAGIIVIAVLSLVAGSEIEITEHMIQRVTSLYGVEAGRRMRAWREVIVLGDHEGELEQLTLVNDFFNRLRPISDEKLWNKTDYWATPIEAIGVNGADCEDYSLAKYFTLKYMGVAGSKLHITYVKALELNEAHMVLAYYPTPDSDPLILDNIKSVILPATQRQDLRPVYSFNGDGLWTSVNRARGNRVGSADQINLWKDFNTRLDQQLTDI